MAEYSEKLAGVVRDTLKRRGLSARDVARMSGGAVSHVTVSEMVRGLVPGVEKLAAFAQALGDDPNVFLALAGKPFEFAAGDAAARKREEILDPRVAEAARAMTKLNPEQQESVLRLLQSMGTDRVMFAHAGA